MKKRDIPDKLCAFCEYATLLLDGETCLCKKKGAVSADHVCFSFAYDPLKTHAEPVKRHSFKPETMD